MYIWETKREMERETERGCEQNRFPHLFIYLFLYSHIYLFIYLYCLTARDFIRPKVKHYLKKQNKTNKNKQANNHKIPTI